MAGLDTNPQWFKDLLEQYPMTEGFPQSCVGERSAVAEEQTSKVLTAPPNPGLLMTTAKVSGKL